MKHELLNSHIHSSTFFGNIFSLEEILTSKNISKFYNDQQRDTTTARFLYIITRLINCSARDTSQPLAAGVPRSPEMPPASSDLSSLEPGLAEQVEPQSPEPSAVLSAVSLESSRWSRTSAAGSYQPRPRGRRSAPHKWASASAPARYFRSFPLGGCTDRYPCPSNWTPLKRSSPCLLLPPGQQVPFSLFLRAVRVQLQMTRAHETWRSLCLLASAWPLMWSRLWGFSYCWF